MPRSAAQERASRTARSKARSKPGARTAKRRRSPAAARQEHRTAAHPAAVELEVCPDAAVLPQLGLVAGRDRGRPGRATSAAVDAKLAIEELRGAVVVLVGAARLPSGWRREAAELAGLGKIALAGRLLDDILDPPRSTADSS